MDESGLQVLFPGIANKIENALQKWRLNLAARLGKHVAAQRSSSVGAKSSAAHEYQIIDRFEQEFEPEESSTKPVFCSDSTGLYTRQCTSSKSQNPRRESLPP